MARREWVSGSPDTGALQADSPNWSDLTTFQKALNFAQGASGPQEPASQGGELAQRLDWPPPISIGFYHLMGSGLVMNG